MTSPKKTKPICLEWLTLAYTLFITLLMACFWTEMKNPLPLLEGRAFIVGGMCLLYLIYRAKPGRYTLFLRYLFPLTLLGYWYPDTYEFCQLFPNLDHVFSQAELTLFGCQPSIVFSQWMPSKLWSELFHLGYFSYYPLIFLTILEPWATNRKAFERTAFIVLGSFFLYYLIYLFLPVAGPQYYFQAVGFDRIEEGVFPALGDYFRTHSDLAPSPGPEGFFRGLVESTQASGERPTAAFPSSHVGVSTVLMLLLWTNRRCLFFLSLPFYILLCAATVYIQAHYLIDVFGGWLTAVAFYFLFQWTYNRFFRADNPFTGTEPVEE